VRLEAAVRTAALAISRGLGHPQLGR